MKTNRVKKLYSYESAREHLERYHKTPNWKCPIDKQYCDIECYCYGAAEIVEHKIYLPQQKFSVKPQYCSIMFFTKGGNDMAITEDD